MSLASLLPEIKEGEKKNLALASETD